MIPRSFYFLRHGETDWNRQSLIQGHSDIPLNETGRAQARDIVPVMRKLPIDRIISSNLLRAQETAGIINDVLGRPFEIDAMLKERNFGIFEGKSISEIEKLKAEMNATGLVPEENGYPCPPQGEPYGDFRQRTVEAISRSLSSHEGENILFVAHGGLYRVLRRCLFDCVDMSPNVQPFHFERKGGIWALHTIVL